MCYVSGVEEKGRRRKENFSNCFQGHRMKLSKGQNGFIRNISLWDNLFLQNTC